MRNGLIGEYFEVAVIGRGHPIWDKVRQYDSMHTLEIFKLRGAEDAESGEFGAIGG